MSGILQAVMRDFISSGGLPMPIGKVYGGGYFAGQINISGAKYNLVVAPKSTGETLGVQYGPYGITTGATSVIDGPANSANLSARGGLYQAAQFCEALTIGGYSDWYLPAKNELEVLYYYLKPNLTDNDTSSGSNANAVLPEPISTNYTTSAPSQTIAGIGFRAGETNAFGNIIVWASTEVGADGGVIQSFNNGDQTATGKEDLRYVRAIRRIAA